MSQARAFFTRCLAICSAAAAFSAAAAQTPPDEPPTSGAPNANIPAASSQSGAPETAQRGRDLETIIRRLLRIKTESGAEEPKRLQLLLLPVISLSPAKGFVFGVEGDGTYRGKDPTTLVSSFFGSIAYTSKNQLLISADYSLFTTGNRWNLGGDFDWVDASQEASRLGGATPASPANTIEYKLLGFHPTARRRIGQGLFAGPGYNFTRYQNIVATPAAAALMTEYQGHGVGRRGSSTASGVSMDLLYETRDNPINATRGVYASLSYRLFSKFLGSDQNWQSLILEGRLYPRVPSYSRNVLALRALGWFTVSGKPPYLELPAVASDPLGQAGRGYLNGQYRGRNLLYGEAEYRFGISRDGFFGGVLFINVSSFTEADSNRFKHLIPAAGVGLRVKFNKNNGSNLGVDYARGKQGSSEIYVGLNEAF